MNKKAPKHVSPVSPLGPARVGEKPTIVIPLREYHPSGVPSEKEFRVYQLEREITHQINELVRHKEIIRVLRSALVEEKDMWDLGLNHGQWPSIGQVHKLLNRIESALDYKGPAFVEPNYSRQDFKK